MHLELSTKNVAILPWSHCANIANKTHLILEAYWDAYKPTLTDEL